jgi:mono/diheme cytochrome c family protein
MVDVAGCRPGRMQNGVALRMLALVLSCGPTLSLAASPSPAEIPDTLEQRLTACAACHGKLGEGAKKGEIYPRLAGKPSGYLYNQLINFRQGRRKYAVMNYMVGYMSDAYLKEIADYYSKLRPEYPAAASTASPATLALGKTLATRGDRSRHLPACITCHGRELTGMAPAIPGLAGLTADYIGAQMGAWKSDRRVAREPDCMARIADLLTPQDISAVAAWLANQPASAKAPPVLSAAAKLPLQCGSVAPQPTVSRPPKVERPEQVVRGEYLARAGDCSACHTVKGGESYAGGVPIPTPFGTLYAPNITPDSDTGIGKWTADDFWRALHDGRSKDGTLLYPAFPYTNYTKVVRADADDLFAYFRSVKPVRKPSRKHELTFPYNQRKLLIGWRALYFKAGEYQDDAAQTKEWNRGAYLVDGLGHCNACHSSRNMLGAVSTGDVVAGGLIPIQNWYAPSLTSNRETGLGDWDVSEVVDLLKTGVSARGVVFGPMSVVVHDSLQHLTVADVTAMATYLKSQTQEEDSPEPPQIKVTDKQAEALIARGAKLYENRCVDCHQRRGEGVPRVYPPLENNESIVMRYQINAIRIVVNGGFPPSTQDNPRPYGMPPFGQDLTDEEIAAVVSYVRQSWGNHAPAVSPAEITSARGIPVD